MNNLKQNYRILVVEDDNVNQKIVKNILTNLGHKVILVDNGRLALYMLSKDSDFDLIFMDMQMPELDGLSTTKRIREIEEEEGKEPFTIIAMTANAGEDDVKRCLDAGMNDLISKPVTIEICEEAILDWENGKHEQTHIEKASKLSENTPIDMKHFSSITLDDTDVQLEIAQDFIDATKIDIETLLETEIGSSTWIKTSHKLKGSSLNVGANELAAICNKAEFDFEDYSKKEMEILITGAYKSVKDFFNDMIKRLAFM